MSIFQVSKMPYSALTTMLTIDAGGRSSQEGIEMYGNNNTFFEGDVKDLNSAGQGCWTSSRNDGTQTSAFISMCVNNTTFWNPQSYNVGGPKDSSLEFSSGDGYIVQMLAGQRTYFLNGGVERLVGHSSAPQHP